MPFHPVTAALMYRGIYTVPNILAEQRPVEIPEDELEGERVWGAAGACWGSGGMTGASHGVMGGHGQDGHRAPPGSQPPPGLQLELGVPAGIGGDGQVDFEEFVTLLGPKLSTSGIPEKFHGTDFDTVFWKCDMQKLTVDELKRLLYDTFCEHLSMKDIENIIMTEEESHMGTAEECPVDVETCSSQQIRQTCVRKSLICAFAIAFIISVMLIAANQVLRSGMK
ncbi:CABP7 protein, partial [Eulacestoma nigropectus]|nr:CABP7 protein [Eulacestoma nigropectus]